jgi:drug/metabolite transporter (DMT)-like permease/prolyl-tRNA editing enzyme YbaK/EbsC (Cys-tRNA(Pro) deacylase)
MVLGSGLLFAVNGTVSKLVLQSGISAPQLTLIRATGAFTGLLALSLVLSPGPRRLTVTRRELPLIAGVGLTGFFLVPMLYFVAIARLPVGIALLFEYTAPLLVALWARFGQRQRVRPRLWGGLMLSLAGLACVVEVWGAPRLDGLGVLAGIGAAVLLALYYLLGAHGVRRRDTLSLTTWAFGASAVAGLLTRALLGGPGWAPLTASTGGGIPIALLCAYVVVLGSIAPYLLVAGGLRQLPATSVGIIGMVEPVVASAVAWIALGEALNLAQLVGGGLVLSGVALAETARIATGAERAVTAPDAVLVTGMEKPPDDRVDGGDCSPERPASSKMGAMQLHLNVQAVQDALDSAGARDASGQPSVVRMLPTAVHTAVAAAAALGVEVGQIANSLIFNADGEPLLVLTSGAHRVDTGKVAAALGVTMLRRATADFVRDRTGQPIGGVAPLGHPKAVRTLVDSSLERYEEVWAAGGVPQAVFPTTYAELVRVTDGTPAEVA